MGGGSKSGGAAREVAWRAYQLTLRGELPGLEHELAKALREDSLSPGLRESLAATAREVSRNEYLVSRDEARALRVAAEKVNARFRELITRDSRYVERFKPYVIPPKDLRRRGRNLNPEFVGTWIERRGRYIYITYWFRFPYDINPGDGPEFEPFTVIIDRYTGRAMEYQVRAHWNIIGIDPEAVMHVRGRPVIAFSSRGHTPRVVLKELRPEAVIVRKVVNPAFVFAPLWVLTRKRPKHLTDIEPEIHVGPSRKEVSTWGRNPLSSPWYEELP